MKADQVLATVVPTAPVPARPPTASVRAKDARKPASMAGQPASTSRKPANPAAEGAPAAYAVQLRGLRKTYPSGDEELTVLQGMDLAVKRGEYVSIMGPSGSGKSSLLNLIGLLDVPTGGGLRLMGQDVAGLSSRQRAMARRRWLGFIFQSFNLMPRLSALHNVMLPMAIAGVPRKDRAVKARLLLHAVGLGDRMDHRPNKLSGGQRQRVAIARALALDPPILLADEPTGNLDTKTGLEILGLFQRLHREGKTIIQVTHDPEVAAESERVIHVRDGAIERQEFTRHHPTAPGTVVEARKPPAGPAKPPQAQPAKNGAATDRPGPPARESPPTATRRTKGGP